jgi:hypothetical protein
MSEWLRSAPEKPAWDASMPAALARPGIRWTGDDCLVDGLSGHLERESQGGAQLVAGSPELAQRFRRSLGPIGSQ